MALVTLLRENCELPEYGWSLWVRAMAPALGEDYEFKGRGGGHAGYMYKCIGSNLSNYAMHCGIYEWEARKAGQPNGVVNVGSTCRSKAGALKGRIREYCRDGSHKDVLIDDALTLRDTNFGLVLNPLELELVKRPLQKMQKTSPWLSITMLGTLETMR